MITEIKNFEQGVITDGDSPDMPVGTVRKLNNLDIDKTTQQLVCRHPFHLYEKIATFFENFPSYQGYFIYSVTQYTAGIVIPQYNTMLIYRSVLNSYDSVTRQPIEGRWDWIIVDNAIRGGDGFPFTKLAEENAKTHCEPAAVLGKVRIALGNDTHYRIFFTQEPHRFFKSSHGSFTNGWLIEKEATDPVLFNGLDTIVPYQNGVYFPNNSSGENAALYMDGRLYHSYLGSAALGYSTRSNAPTALTKGKYEVIISPVFDKDLKQYGAAVAKTQFTILEDPKEKGNSTAKASPFLEVFSTYTVNVPLPFSWYGAGSTRTRSGAGVTRINIQDQINKGWTKAFYNHPDIGGPNGFFQATDFEGWGIVLQNNVYPGYSKGDVFVFHTPGVHFTNYSPVPSDKVTDGYYFENRRTRQKFYPNALPAGFFNNLTDIDVVAECYDFNQSEATNYNDFYYAVQYPAGSTPTSRLYKNGDTFTTDNTNLTYDIVLVDGNTTTVVLANEKHKSIEQAGSALSQQVTNPDTPFLFYNDRDFPKHFREFGSGGSRTPSTLQVIYFMDRFNGALAENPWISRGVVPRTGTSADNWIQSVTRNASWTFYHFPGTAGPLTYQTTLEGTAVTLEFEVQIDGLNPRLLDYAIFMRQTPIELPESGDFGLIEYLGVREDSDYLTREWTPIFDSSGRLDKVSIEVTLNSITRNIYYGSWGEVYDLDGVYFRPYDHTEEDITRKMNQITPVRNRMHAIGVNSDVGQEMVARTPVSAGQPQLDVWFKPLIAHAGKGYAILSAIEFQDRLLWFQKNSLVYAAFGDSRRASDYQFMNSGGGVGTHIKRSIAKSNDAVFFANYDGIWRFDGSKPTDIALGRISDYWRYEVTKEQKDASFGGYNPKTNEYWLFIPYDPSSFFSPMLQEWTPDTPQPDPDYVPENLVTKGVVWIWDDNDFPGRSWRTYTLDPTRLAPAYNKKRLSYYQGRMMQHTPTVFFADYDNNWIFITHTELWFKDQQGLTSFVGSAEISYFWPGENVINQFPQFPIKFEVETQNLGTRAQDIIPDMFRLIGEDYPLDYKLTLNVYRNNSTSDTETLTLTATNRRQRRLDRRRSSTLRFGLSGEYDPIVQPDPFVSSGVPEFITEDTFVLRRPKIKEIHIGIMPNKRRT